MVSVVMALECILLNGPGLDIALLNSVDELIIGYVCCPTIGKESASASRIDNRNDHEECNDNYHADQRCNIVQIDAPGPMDLPSILVLRAAINSARIK